MQTPGWRAGWRTSTRSNNGANCVEVDVTAAGVLMRDTKDRGSGPVIDFTADEWARFVHEALDGLPSANGAVTVSHRGTVTEVRSPATGRTLRYTPGEWAAFLGGARDGEFDYESQVPAGAAGRRCGTAQLAGAGVGLCQLGGLAATRGRTPASGADQVADPAANFAVPVRV